MVVRGVLIMSGPGETFGQVCAERDQRGQGWSRPSGWIIRRRFSSSLATDAGTRYVAHQRMEQHQWRYRYNVIHMDLGLKEGRVQGHYKCAPLGLSNGFLWWRANYATCRGFTSAAWIKTRGGNKPSEGLFSRASALW
jgi:hypothetical protein